MLGFKKIVQELNEQGLLMRGGLWRLHKVHDAFSDPTCRGEYRYNMRDSKKRILRLESAWVRCTVDALIEEQLFDEVRRKRASHDPKKLR